MKRKTTASASDDREKRLVGAVNEDEKLGAIEKETRLLFSKSDDHVELYTEEGGLMRQLLQHPEFRLEKLRVVTEDSWGQYVDPDDFDGGTITGVDGWVPIGVLSLKTSSRSTSQHAAIVSERVLRGE